MWDTPKPVVENHDLIGGLQWTDGALDRQMDRTDRERTRKGRGKKGGEYLSFLWIRVRVRVRVRG